MTREEAKKAFREIASEEFAHIPEENRIDYEFSERFDERDENCESFIESLFSENTPVKRKHEK